MNRGKRGEIIFKDKDDYFYFINLLKDVVEMWNVRLSAYCLMGTHYHILIQIPNAILSRCMRHINGVYTQYFMKETPEKINKIFGQRKWSPIIGSDVFLDCVKETFFEKKRHVEIPESKALAPETEKIKEMVCRSYGVKNEDILFSKRGMRNEARNTAIYLLRQLRGVKLDKIGREFGLTNYSTVSTIIERTKKQSCQ